jgi:hypothetical protein
LVLLTIPDAASREFYLKQTIVRCLGFAAWTVTRNAGHEIALRSVINMRVWLTRKYAERLNGVDLSGRHVGDVIDLPQAEAKLLVAEEWALPDRRSSVRDEDRSDDNR